MKKPDEFDFRANSPQLDQLNPKRKALGLAPITPEQWRRIEIDRKVAEIEPEVRRRIVRNTIGEWIMAIAIFGFIGPMVFGGFSFGDKADQIIAIIAIGSFVWWAWRASRRRRCLELGLKGKVSR